MAKNSFLPSEETSRSQSFERMVSTENGTAKKKHVRADDHISFVSGQFSRISAELSRLFVVSIIKGTEGKSQMKNKGLSNLLPFVRPKRSQG
jgi:hypothetical protein